MSDDKLLQRLTNDLAPRAAQLEKDNDAQKGPMQDVINKLSVAIQTSNQPALKQYTKTLEDQVEIYSSLVNRAKRLVEEIGTLNSNDADAIKRASALKGKADASLEKIMRNYTKLKELLDMAHKKANDPAVAAVMAQWAEMESWMTTSRDVTRLRVKQMETLAELARSAMKDGDDKSLAQAQEKAKLRAGWKPTQLEIGDKYMKFCVRCEQVLGKNLQDELKRDIAKFAKMVTEIAELNDKLDKYAEALKKLKMPAAKAASAPKLYYSKAAAVLGVDEAKLKKAWDAGSANPEKALDGLAKEKGAKFKTGKEGLATLKRAKLVP